MSADAGDRPVNRVDDDLVVMMRDVLARLATIGGEPGDGGDPQPAGGGAAGGDDVAWAMLREVGLARLTAPEGSGGSGAGWAEAASLLRLAARAGVATPYAETDLVVGPLRRAAGLDDATRGTATLAVMGPDGRARRVPWGGATDTVLCVRKRSDGAAGPGYEGTEVTTTSLGYLDPVPGTSAIRTADLAPPGDAEWTPVPAEDVEVAVLNGALARAVQCVGAAEGMLDAAVEHTTTRTQFGRPLARFQSVQNLVVDLAAETVLARAAVDLAVADAVDTGLRGPLSGFRVAVARSVTGRAMGVAVRNAHQVHGAIGTTHEHSLHRLTLPALQWRVEFGSAVFWESLLAGAAVAGGADAVWPMVCEGVPLRRAGAAWLDRVTGL